MQTTPTPKVSEVCFFSNYLELKGATSDEENEMLIRARYQVVNDGVLLLESFKLYHAADRAEVRATHAFRFLLSCFFLYFIASFFF